MSGRNTYIGQGNSSEQNLLEDLIIESLSIYGQTLYYLPRQYVNKDIILGEDTLSKFNNAYPIEMYFENVSQFDGQGPFLQKFGLFQEQSANLTVSRRRWQQLVGQYGNTFVPNRPNEGDLLYFPLTKGLFEIKFVQHQDPFYQLGKLYVYKLSVELFQYASERIDTGVPEIDAFESLKTFTTDPTRTDAMFVNSITVTNVGLGYTSVPTLTFTGGNYKTAATGTLGIDTTTGKINAVNLTATGSAYKSVPTLTITAPTGQQATATANIVAGEIDTITIVNAGKFYKAGTTVTITGDGANATATATISSTGTIEDIVITNRGSGYTTATVTISAPNNLIQATATATIGLNIDQQGGFADNTALKVERTHDGKRVAWSEDNPFGEF